MAGVYSTLFIEVNAVNPSTGYVVPDGFIAVVRDVQVLFYGSPEDAAGGVRNESTGVWIAYHLQVDPYEFYSWSGRQVVPAGSEIQGFGSGPSAISIRACGYLLSAP